MNKPLRSGLSTHGSTAALVAILLAAGATGVCANPVIDIQSGDGGVGVIASATGGGHFVVGGALDVKFSLSANQRPDGSASGHHRHEVTLGGLPIAFTGEVICVSVDAEAGRAWIGSIITENDSEHPAFTEARHQPGKDIWFRVLDSGEGQAEPDRSTFVGFEGDAGFITSQEYCDGMPWPEDNARTSPVTEGNIQVRP